MAKKFFTYEQQLNKLQQEKYLIIPDTDTAKLALENLSYYSLPCVTHLLKTNKMKEPTKSKLTL